MKFAIFLLFVLAVQSVYAESIPYPHQIGVRQSNNNADVSEVIGSETAKPVNDSNFKNLYIVVALGLILIALIIALIIMVKNK